MLDNSNLLEFLNAVNTPRIIANKLIKEHKLSVDEYEVLLINRDEELFDLLKNEAVKLRKQIYLLWH